MQRPTRMQPVCLGACIVSFHEAERFLRDLGITGPPGEHLLYWDQISYTRFLFDFDRWNSPRKGGSQSRLKCHITTQSAQSAPPRLGKAVVM